MVVAVALTGSEAALRAGCRTAQRTGRPLDLVHVMPYADRSSGPHTERLHRASLRAGELTGPGTVVHSELLRGPVVPALVHAARSCALLVTGQRAHAGGVASTAAWVLDETDAPSLLVPDSWSEDQHGVVTVGVDPGNIDEEALVTALTEARLRRAALRVLIATGCSPSITTAALRDRVETRLERLGGDACDLAVEPVAGAAGPALVVASRSSDLVVLGRHRPGPVTESRLGVIGRAVLRGAGCPVLVTRPAHLHAALVCGPGPTDLPTLHAPPRG